MTFGIRSNRLLERDPNSCLQKSGRETTSRSPGFLSWAVDGNGDYSLWKTNKKVTSTVGRSATIGRGGRGGACGHRVGTRKGLGLSTYFTDFTARTRRSPASLVETRGAT